MNIQIQSLSLPNHTLTPAPHIIFPSLRPPYSTHHSTKLVSKSGICNSIKRVSKSPTCLKNLGGSVKVRCGGIAQNNENDDDGFYMRRCVELARKAIGRTSPNPMVGCIIVKDGKIVGEGFHPKAGQPHAEVKPTFLSFFSCAIRMKDSFVCVCGTVVCIFFSLFFIQICVIIF